MDGMKHPEVELIGTIPGTRTRVGIETWARGNSSPDDIAKGHGYLIRFLYDIGSNTYRAAYCVKEEVFEWAP